MSKLNKIRVHIRLKNTQGGNGMKVIISKENMVYYKELERYLTQLIDKDMEDIMAMEEIDYQKPHTTISHVRNRMQDNAELLDDLQEYLTLHS